jgi:CO/xanthine dehydrogenase Mo-binding subunit
MAYDESGQLLNASFMDFLMPYVTEVPDLASPSTTWRPPRRSTRSASRAPARRA